MITPALDRMLDLAAQNTACAREALGRGQYATAQMNVQAARELLERFDAKLSEPEAEPISETKTPAPNQS